MRVRSACRAAEPDRAARCRLSRPRGRPRRPPGPARSGGTADASLARHRTDLQSSHSSTPTVSRTPITKCRRAVAPSMGRSARPSWGPSASLPARPPVGGQRAPRARPSGSWTAPRWRAPQPPGRPDRSDPQPLARGEWPTSSSSPPGRWRCPGGCWLGGALLPAVRPGRRPRGRRPSRSRTTTLPGQNDREGGVLHVRRASRGHQTEEHEHEDLPETEVAIWVRPSGVRPSGQHTDEPQRQKPPGHPGHERQPGQSRHGEGHRRRQPDLTDGGEPLADEPDRPDSSNVGAARCRPRNRSRSWSRPGYPGRQPAPTPR